MAKLLEIQDLQTLFYTSAGTVKAVDEIFAIRPLREVRHLRRSRVLDVVRRSHEVEHESEPHERAHRDARDDGGSALLSSIGVDGLSVAVNKTHGTSVQLPVR